MLARPGLPSFDYVRASTPKQVTDLLRAHGDAARLLMGGTDLFVRMRDGAIRPQVLIDVKHLPGMQDIAYSERRGLVVGAAVTMNQLAAHPAVATHYPLLAEAARSVASYQLRNRATVGGNLCNASPAADLAPSTLVLDGSVLLTGSDGERQVQAESFFLGPGRTAIRADEYAAAILFPSAPDGLQSAGRIAHGACRYLKLGRNKIGDLALVSVAALGAADGATASGFRFHIALGAVAPVPLRVPDAEQALATHPPGEQAFAMAAELAAERATPIDDVRSSAAYRKAMVHNLTLRALRGIWADLYAATA